MRKRGGEDSGENERHEEYAGRYYGKLLPNVTGL